MKTHEIPVNKDAALFLSRKMRITSLQEVLNKLAMAVCSPVTVQEVRRILRERPLKDESNQLCIKLVVRVDAADSAKIWVMMTTTIQSELGRETYAGLEV